MKSPKFPTLFALFALLWTLAVIYGSLVPLRYVPIRWEETVKRFEETRYFQIGVEGRADWVANGLLFFPIGFLGTAAILGGRRRIGMGIVALVGVASLGSVLAVALEFVQIWFPPRTVSWNDVVAEIVGVVLGSTSWLAIGPALVDWFAGWRLRLPAAEHVRRLLQVYLVALLLYSVLPLDVIISADELALKHASGRIGFGLLPADIAGPVGLAKLAAHVLMFVPVGVLVAWPPANGGVRPAGRALTLGLVVVVCTELAQLVVFTRYATTGDLLLGGLGITMGVGLMQLPQTVRQQVSRQLLSARNPANQVTWLMLTLGYAAIVFLMFTGPWELEQDPTIVRERWNGLASPPGARLYVGTEFNALNQVLAKLGIFAVLGGLTVRTVDQVARNKRQRWALLTLGWLAIATLAVGIETVQVWLAHGTADLTDSAIYAAGGALGIAALLSARRILRLDPLTGGNGAGIANGQAPAVAETTRQAQSPSIARVSQASK